MPFEPPSNKPLSPREKAEQKLRDREAPQELSSRDKDFLIQELMTREIKLEMQNENLRNAQLELEASRRNYTDLYDFAPVAFFSFDRNGVITDVNLTGARLLGAGDKSILMNKPFSCLIEAASVDLFHKHLRNAIESGVRQTCEIRIKRKDGLLFDAELLSLAGNAEPIVCQTAVCDITTRKAYDRTLVDSKEQYRALVEASPESIAVCEAGHFVYINPAGLELFGAQNLAEVVGKKALDFVHPDFRPALEERIRDVEKNGQVLHSHDMKILRTNGQPLDVEVMANPIAFTERSAVQLIIKDISDRKETELRLRLQGTVLSQVSDAVIAVGKDGRVIFWNKGAERLYKLTAEEVIGKRREEIYRYRWLTPADERAAREAMATTGFLRGENVHILKNGEQIYVESSVSVLTDWSDAPVGWIAVMRDVTERKMFERKLKESEERYRSLVESSPDAILVHQEGKLVYVNPATLKLVGARDLDEIIGKNVLDFVHPDLQTRTEERFRQAEESGLPLPSRESKVIRLDGRVVHIEAVGTHIMYGGRPAIQIIAKDITERKEFEKALRNSEKLYRLMFESNPHPMWIYDTDTLRFLFVNDTAVNRYGYSKEEFLSMTIKDIRPSEDAAVLFDNVSKIANGLYDAGNWRHKKKDGSVIEVEIISHNLKIEGKDARVILAHDVTERKEAERALRESEERQRAVFDNSPMAIIAKDLQGRHIIFNRQAEKWMNVRREDILGKTVYDFLPKNEADQCLTGDRKVIDSRAPLQAEEIMELPDGIHTHLTVKFPLFDAAGSLYAVCCIMSDITEMKRAEQAFRESEERQRAVFDNSPIAIFAKDLQGRFILWNRQAELWLGMREDDILGKTDYDLFPKEVADRLAANDRRVIESRVPLETEEVTSYGGQERIHLDIKFPLFDSSGHPYAVCGISSDITERKRAEQEIKTARDAALRDRRKLEIILNTIPSGVFVAEGPAGVITLQNEQTFQILGRNVDGGTAADRITQYEMTKSDGTLFKPRELPYLRSLLDGEQVRDVEMTFKRPDGRKLTVLANAAPLRDSEGNISASVTAFNDISERKEAEDALKRARIELELRVRERTAELAATVAALQSEIAERKRTAAERDKLVAAVESTAEAIVVTDSRGIIQYVNPSFQQITGYQRQEAIGRDLHFLDSGQHDEDFFPRMRETIRTDGVWKGRLINKKKDGSIYYEDCTYSPVKDRSGNIVNYVSIKHDVTEKLRLESIAETVDAMNNIGYVFSGIRHEIGNPVSSLLIVLSLLKKKYDTNPNDTIREYVDQAISQVERIEYLLKSLKNFNMYENLQIRSVELSSFLGKFIPLVTADLTKKGITLQVEAAPAPCWAYVDPRALQQALVNVVVNASEAVTGRPEPTIVLNASKFGSMVQIRVADNGTGIPEDRKKDLFKPFYTTKSNGTGLGLVITRKLVSRMKGFIEIASRKDEGTTVDIYLPEGTVERNS